MTQTADAQEKTMTTAKVTQCIPALQSNDAAASFAFYQSALGFQKNWEHRYAEGLPLFIEMSIEGMTVFITEHENESAFGSELYFYVEEIDALAASIKEKGIPFEVEPYDTPYGTREFNLKDPDGNKLRIGQRM